MRVNIWLLRIVWTALPVAAGGAASSALAGWDQAPGVAVQLTLWFGWGVGLGLLALPRLATITGVRLLASLGTTAAVLASVTDVPAAEKTVAFGMTALALALAATPTFARACLQRVAYGSEERFPLRTPPGLFLGILPAAVAVVGAGVVAGPLLVATGRGGLGVPIWAAGWVAAAWTIRRIHTLAGRFVVLVPAGLVVADPLTLTDPVLCTRDRITAIEPVDPRRGIPEGSLDLRLGAGSGSLLVATDPPLEVPRRMRGRSELGTAAGLVVACATPRAFVERAAARRLPVRGTGGRAARPVA